MKNFGEIFKGGSLDEEAFGRILTEKGYSLLDGEERREIEERFERERSDHAAELSKTRAAAALKYELMRCGAHNPTLAAAAIGIDGFAGGEAEALAYAAEKVAAFRRDEPYMFADAASPAVSTGALHGASGIDPDTMSDSEYYSHIRMN